MSGYYQEIDHEKLAQMAQRTESLIVLDKIVGPFASTESRILPIFQEAKQTLEDDIIHQIQGCIYIGNKRVEAYDFKFTLQTIVEIALKGPYLQASMIQILRSIAIIFSGSF